MCDYSLENVKSREAEVADQLVSTVFPNTITRGFSDPSDSSVAVCLRPGTEIAFVRGAVAYEDPVTHKITRVAETAAVFRKINPDNPCAHHDALEFPSGTIIPVAKLLPGQHAAVLQLPATEKKPAAPAAAAKSSSRRLESVR